MPVNQKEADKGYIAIKSESANCEGCDFYKKRGCGKTACAAAARTDQISVIFKKGKAPKPKPDSDAAWLMKRVDDMAINNIDAYVTKHEVVSRLRRIAKRLNGGKLP